MIEIGDIVGRLFSFLVKHKYYVIVFFVLICIPAVIGIGLIDTNFEVATFMPEDANSIAGEKIEEEEFSTAMRAYVLLEDKDNWQTIELIERIESIDGVRQVEWMDDTLDIYMPEDFLSDKALAQYKKGNDTIIIIEFREDVIQQTIDNAIQEIASLMEQGGYFGGSPVVIHELRNLLKHEQSIYLLIAGGILIALLAISLSSYMAPILCIINIAIAIMLNYGTNFLVKDQVSFLTVAIAAILQLAVSMDYSIFLIHRFEEDLLSLHGDVDKAMVSSMRSTLTAISSSAMTDCAGFVALVFMHNQVRSYR